MGVYFKTGTGSAVSFPWPIYLLVVLPLQMLYYIFAGAVWLVTQLVRLSIYVAVVSGEAWRRHKQNGA